MVASENCIVKFEKDVGDKDDELKKVRDRAADEINSLEARLHDRVEDVNRTGLELAELQANFRVLVNDSEKNIFVEVHNPSAMACEYEWSFFEEIVVLDPEGAEHSHVQANPAVQSSQIVSSAADSTDDLLFCPSVYVAGRRLGRGVDRVSVRRSVGRASPGHRFRRPRRAVGRRHVHHQRLQRAAARNHGERHSAAPASISPGDRGDS